jgi:hypothetical protein
MWHGLCILSCRLLLSSLIEIGFPAAKNYLLPLPQKASYFFSRRHGTVVVAILDGTALSLWQSS